MRICSVSVKSNKRSAGIGYRCSYLCLFRAPLSPKLGIDEALFVLTPEVIVLESLSETEGSGSNGILLNPDSKSDARNSIEWSNRICMLRL